MRLILAAFAASTIASAAFAAPQGVFLSPDGVMAIAPQPGAAGMPARATHNAASSVIFSNLASSYPDGLYLSSQGFYFAGAGAGGEVWVAVTFVPAASAVAEEVTAPIGRLGGKNEITLAIASDSAGLPGTILWSGVAKKLPAFSTCCGLVTAKIKGGLPLTAGTSYWAVVQTDANESSTFGAWNVSTTEQITPTPVARNEAEAGWKISSTTAFPPAVAIYGK